MPIPKPNTDEDQKEFISRCMGDKGMQEYDQEQRAAICYQTWRDKDKTEMSDDAVLSEVKNGLVRVAIAYTGQKFKQGDKEFTISLADLQQMRRNLSTREVPIDYEHLSARADIPPGWSKAAGWMKPEAPEIEKLSDGRSVLWGWFEPTPAMAASIRQKEFRYFSPEIHWNAEDEKGKGVGTKLAAGAITNRPFLKDLAPIEIGAEDYPALLEAVALSEARRMIDIDQVHVPKDVNTKENTMKNLKFKKIMDGEHKGRIGIFDGDTVVGMCERENMKSYMAEDPDVDEEPDEKDPEKLKAKELIQTRAADAACLLEFAKAKPGETITLAEKFVDQGKLSMAGYLKVQKIERLIDGAIAKGKALPKQRASLFTMAIADYDAAVAFLNDAHVIVDVKAHGIEGDGELKSAEEELQTAVKAYMTEKKVDYATALGEVTRQRPALWRKHINESAVTEETVDR